MLAEATRAGSADLSEGGVPDMFYHAAPRIHSNSGVELRGQGAGNGVPTALVCLLLW